MANSPEGVQNDDFAQRRTFAENKNAAMAYAELQQTQAAKTERDIHDIYAANRERNHVNVEQFNINKPIVNVLYMSELMVGSNYSDVEFYDRTIDRVKALPTEQKPDLIVLSGFFSGDYKYAAKKTRNSIVEEFQSMDKQFHDVHQLIEKAQEIGVPVLYNMGDDDHRINEEYTVVQFKRNKELAKQHTNYLKERAAGDKPGRPQKIQDGSETNDNMSDNWGTVNEARTSEDYTNNLRFQNDIIFAWSLRAGRRLKVADEMAEITKDWPSPIVIDEYFVIRDIEAHRMPDGKISRRHLSNSHKRWLRENSHANEDIKKPPYLIVTDDANLEIKTKGHEYTDWIRHSSMSGGSSATVPTGFLAKPAINLAQRAAFGDKNPDLLVMQNNLENAGMVGSTVIMDTGGALNGERYFETNGLITDLAGTKIKKALTGRNRIPRATSTIHSRKDSGEYSISFLNDKLMEKSASLPERITIAELCDTQIGSISARPDFTVKYLDYIRTKALGERPTALFFGGDHIHGRNYDSFAIESESSGMMSIPTQKEFFRAMLRGALAGMSNEEVKAIERINIQTGNHEYNSGSFRGKNAHGDTFVDYIKDHFAIELARKGYSDKAIDAIVHIQEAMVTQTGEYSYGPMAYEEFGEYGIVMKHFFLGRFARPGGDSPAYQGARFLNAQGSMFEKADFAASGHWHSPQYLETNGKISFVGGAMAGITQYESELGLHGRIAGTLLHIGGGQAPTLEYIPQRTLENHVIKKGDYSNAHLRDLGYEDDVDFEVSKHGFYLPDSMFPKSALQKYLLQQQRDASQRTKNVVVL